MYKSDIVGKDPDVLGRVLFVSDREDKLLFSTVGFPFKSRDNKSSQARRLVGVEEEGLKILFGIKKSDGGLHNTPPRSIVCWSSPYDAHKKRNFEIFGFRFFLCSQLLFFHFFFNFNQNEFYNSLFHRSVKQCMIEVLPKSINSKRASGFQLATKL